MTTSAGIGKDCADMQDIFNMIEGLSLLHLRGTRYRGLGGSIEH